MNSITKRANVGDSVPYTERTNLGQQRSKAMLKRAASLKPKAFEQYAWVLKNGGKVSADDMQAIGLGNSELEIKDSIYSISDAVYKALTPLAGPNSKVQPLSIALLAGDPKVEGLIEALVGPINLLNMVYTSGMYSLSDLQQFASAVAGAVVDIREDLVDQILAPAQYYDRSLDSLTLRQGLDNAGKDI